MLATLKPAAYLGGRRLCDGVTRIVFAFAVEINPKVGQLVLSKKYCSHEL